VILLLGATLRLQSEARFAPRGTGSSLTSYIYNNFAGRATATRRTRLRGGGRPACC